MDQPGDIFSLRAPKSGPVKRQLFRLVRKPLEKMLALDELNEIHSQISAQHDQRSYFEKTLAFMNIGYRVQGDLSKVPTEGPLVIVANHPFGAVEGMILAIAMRAVRPDLKIMANYILGMIPEARDLFIFVDPFGTESATRANIRAMKETISWVRDGKCLGVFPAGEVAHIDLKKRLVTDPPWSPTVARIIRKSNASVLPVYFCGGNTRLFQLLGLLHPKLRTAMLPRELLRRRGTEIEMRVGNVIPASRIASLAGDEETTSYIRMRTYVLAGPSAGKSMASASVPASACEIEPGQDPAAMASDVAGLPADAKICASAGMEVYVAPADRIPAVLREIGRLREITFRKTNEGTGQSTDLDRFDAYYRHLFIWNPNTREVVGAYRLGLTDEILPRYGIRGLYTNTLFKFRMPLMRQISPAIELGRSFVRPEYQRNYLPLLLLWKGIAAFVCQNPKYRYLTGPVSISREYQSSSRQIMVAFLSAKNQANELDRWVKPRMPFKPNRLIASDSEIQSRVAKDVDEMSDLVAEIESDHKGIPVLLRQYLKLGARFIGFNIDPLFSDVLDALMLVDLCSTDYVVLSKYMGQRQCREFRAFHGFDCGENKGTQT